jgi:TRAP-type transport system periplasmic protein
MNRIFDRMGALTSGSALALVLATSAQAQDVTLRFGHVQPESHAFHQGAEKFAEQLARLSDGTMAVDIYPNGVMGNERDLLEALQIGSIDVVTVTSALTGTFNDRFQVFSLPFVFDSYQHAFAAMDDPEIREALEPGLIDVGIRPIGYWIGGARSYYGRDSIAEPTDFTGKRVRTMEEPIYLHTWEELGTIPTPLPFGEVYMALQAGMVDGAEGAINSYISRRFYEVAPHVAFIDYVYSVQMLHISDMTWQRLSEEQRGWVTEAADLATEFERDFILAEDEELLERLEELGVEITRPDPSEFRGRVEPVLAQFRNEAGEENYALVERIQELGAE